MSALALRQEQPADRPAVEALYDRVFGIARKELSSYRLRAGVSFLPELAWLYEDVAVGQVVGAIRFWPVRIGRPGAPCLLLGPVAVHPTHQGEGLGAALTWCGLRRAESLAMPADARESGTWGRVALIGDEPYYRRFGFVRELAQELEFPPPTDPDRRLARELRPGSMQGLRGTVRAWR